MQKLILSTVLVCMTASSVSSFAESLPRRVASDTHVKVVMYDPNNVTVLNGRYGYQTQIFFAPNETVQNVSIGDSLAWQAVPVNNNLFIKPVAASKTNMTVLTNMNSYNFQLDSMRTDVNPTYKLQFTYPEAGFDASNHSNAIATFDPEKLNWKYSFSGSRSLAPVSAFDNGQFTYFKFKNDGMSRIPAVFVLNNDNKETLVNYHMQGNYMVIHTIAKEFVFRAGSTHTFIYNDLV